MWEALETLFARDDFTASFPARAAIAVRTEPGQPVPAVYVKHHEAMRSMLEELVCEGQSASAPRLAAQLELLVEGAIAGTAIDQEPSALRAARELSLLAMSLNGVRSTA
jgi:hypothetical protein